MELRYHYSFYPRTICESITKSVAVNLGHAISFRIVSISVEEGARGTVALPT